MISKNTYIQPVKEEHIQEILTDSPAHNMEIYENRTINQKDAIDYICSEGTQVQAAKSGKIIFIIDNVTKTGTKKQLKTEELDGNQIVLKHENNEMTLYSHLKHASIKVRLDQKVKTGEIIGYSGNTGWSKKPHLHFAVIKDYKNKEGYYSVKPKWK